MACPVCDHTMQSIAADVFWCQRCGTIKERFGGGEHATPPLWIAVNDYGRGNTLAIIKREPAMARHIKAKGETHDDQVV